MDCECDLVGVKRISGWQGKGTEAEGAWHFLLRPSLPQRTTFEVLAQLKRKIKRICSNKKMCIFKINKLRAFQTL